MHSQSAPSYPITLPASQFKRLPYNRPLWLTCTLPWPEVSLLSILEQVQERPRFYWASSTHPLSMVSWGKAAELTDWGEHRFHDIQEQARHLSTRLYALNPDSPIEAGPFWMGSFAFQPRMTEDPLWKAFPDAAFFLPKFQIARLDGQTWLTINHLVERVENSQDILDYFYACVEQVIHLTPVQSPTASFADQSLLAVTPGLNQAAWDKMVNGALARIRGGEFEKVVLARTLQASFAEPPSVIAILQALSDRYPDCYRFLIEPQPGQIFLGASPELLAEVRASAFRTSALAGTMRRGANQQEDEALGQELLGSPKERAEHAIVVQAIQKKIAPLAKTLHTAPRPALRKLGNLQHLETRLEGSLAADWGVLDVIAALHPTPAMGGWPQKAAQAYLAEAEPFNRGWYAAPIGWFDPWGNGLFAVGIRSGLFSGQSATLFAGAGIVADSIPAREWQETQLKFNALLEAIGGKRADG